jgi:hypothetical protein
MPLKRLAEVCETTRCNHLPVGRCDMSTFDSHTVEVMKHALDEAMIRVPKEHSTQAIKAYLAECILKAAANGQTSYDGLVASAADQIPVALSIYL